VLEAEGDRFKVPSPRLLQAGAELVSAGVPLPAVLDLEEALAADLEAVAGRLVDTAANYLVGPAADTSPDDEQLARLAQVIRRVRPLAQMAIDALLARAMERQVNEAMQARLAALAQTDGAGAEAS
jgi:hypothetical protein